MDELASIRPEIIALDGTDRIRPGGIKLEEFFREVRKRYPTQLFMADCSTLEEGIRAADLGFDVIGTTLNGYTAYTKGNALPDIRLIKSLVEKTQKPVIAEGGIWTPEELESVISTGVLAAVVGTAITRPMDITKRFVKALHT